MKNLCHRYRSRQAYMIERKGLQYKLGDGLLMFLYDHLYLLILAAAVAFLTAAGFAATFFISMVVRYQLCIHKRIATKMVRYTQARKPQRVHTQHQYGNQLIHRFKYRKNSTDLSPARAGLRRTLHRRDGYGCDTRHSYRQK